MNIKKPMKLSLSVTRKMIARLAAVQALYAYEMSNKDEHSFVKILDDYFDQEYRQNELSLHDKSLTPNKKFFNGLTTKVLQEIKILDEIIAQHLSAKWELDDLSLVIKSILRLAICELKFMPEIPAKVVINEYTNIAHAFYDDVEAGFVNGILDNIAKKI